MVMSVRDRLEQAINHHRAGRLDAAMQTYRTVLAEAPQQSDALHLLGVALAQAGRPEEGLPLLQQAVAVDPAITDFHADLGTVLRGVGRLADAVAAWQRALELAPGNALLWAKLADLHLKLGQAAEADFSIRQALELDPADATLADLAKDTRAAVEAEFALLTSLVPCRQGTLRHLNADTMEGRSLARYGEFGGSEARLFRPMLRGGETVVEMGAGCGGQTAMLAEAVGLAGRVICWETLPLSRRILTDNLERNGWFQVEVRPGTLGARTGWLGLPPVDYAAAGDFRAIVPVPAAPGGGLSPVREERLDDLGLGRLDCLILNQPGRTLPALEGAGATIARCRPVIYFFNEDPVLSPVLIATVLGLGYRLWWHFTPLDDPANFAASPADAFNGAVRTRLFGVPTELAPDSTSPEEVTGPDDSAAAALARSQAGRPALH